ncbi:hypothetical protein Tco_0972111 [Tanacetum coccineum]
MQSTISRTKIMNTSKKGEVVYTTSLRMVFGVKYSANSRRTCNFSHGTPLNEYSPSSYKDFPRATTMFQNLLKDREVLVLGEADDQKLRQKEQLSEYPVSLRSSRSRTDNRILPPETSMEGYGVHIVNV